MAEDLRVHRETLDLTRTENGLPLPAETKRLDGTALVRVVGGLLHEGERHSGFVPWGAAESTRPCAARRVTPRKLASVGAMSVMRTSPRLPPRTP